MTTYTDLAARRAELEAGRMAAIEAEAARLAAERAHREQLAAIERELLELAQAERRAESDAAQTEYRLMLSRIEATNAGALRAAVDKALTALADVVRVYDAAITDAQRAYTIANNDAYAEQSAPVVPASDDIRTAVADQNAAARAMKNAYRAKIAEYTSIGAPALPWVSVLAAMQAAPDAQKRLYAGVLVACTGEKLTPADDFTPAAVNTHHLLQATVGS